MSDMVAVIVIPSALVSDGLGTIAFTQGMRHLISQTLSHQFALGNLGNGVVNLAVRITGSCYRKARTGCLPWFTKGMLRLRDQQSCPGWACSCQDITFVHIDRSEDNFQQPAEGKQQGVSETDREARGREGPRFSP